LLPRVVKKSLSLKVKRPGFPGVVFGEAYRGEASAARDMASLAREAAFDPVLPFDLVPSGWRLLNYKRR
jgi:hypothetical protein